MTTEVQKRPSPSLRPALFSLVAAVALMVACGGLAVTLVLVLLLVAVFGLMYALGEALAKDGLAPLPKRAPRAREISEAVPSIPSEHVPCVERAA